MKFGSVGAVIAAASKKDAVPLLKVGSIPIVRRIVLTLQQAGRASHRAAQRNTAADLGV